MYVKIKAAGLAKRFDKFTVFKDLGFSVSTSSSLAVTGDNGSGKSTLLEIISGIQKPTAGKVIYEIDGKEADLSEMRSNMGFSSLKIHPYGELNALENIQFVFNKNKANKNFEEHAKDLLNKLDLYNDRDKRVKFFSSGMKQRLRFLFAVLHDAHVLILDEPGSNLDKNGKDIIYSYIDSVKKKKLIIIASNDNKEAGLCNDRINLEKRCLEEHGQGLQG